MTTYLGKSCSFCLPRVAFVNCRQFMYLVISLLVLRAGYGINENIHKMEGGSYYVVSANKASSVTLQSPGNKSQRKHCNFANFK